jgi:hypothetical protein
MDRLVPGKRPTLARAAVLAVTAGCAAAAALLGACAHSASKPTESEMLGLLALLPGRYDNSAQVELDTRTGTRPVPDAIELVITRVLTPRLGHHVYYAQEMAADNPLRVFSQKMYSFQFDAKRGTVETVYEFVDPRRWRDGQQNPDLFTSVETEDVQAEGCPILWKKTPAGFVGNHDGKICPASPATRIELGVGTLTIGEYKLRKSR